jgi:hypothetical protein
MVKLSQTIFFLVHLKIKFKLKLKNIFYMVKLFFIFYLIYKM